MSRVIFEREKGQRVPIRVWARAIDDKTIAQLQVLAAQPYVVDHVAAMADAHVSAGVAVGTVFATEATLVPAALGGDLGCGMTAVRVGIMADAFDRRALRTIVAQLERAIPAGSNTHRGRGIEVPDALLERPLSTNALEHARRAIAPRQFATLGGGNHFVELDRDHDGMLWLLVHSGSRGLGGAIASHHSGGAASKATRGIEGLDAREGDGRAYLDDLEVAYAFAAANRAQLAARALAVIADVHGAAIEPETVVDLHHNFVVRESWGGRDVIVHRKGAIAAPAGVLALVPGSMGTASYLVEGRGEPLAFGSCSHGAGRVMRRREARKQIDARALARSMRRVVYPERYAAALVEEAPDAYRDVSEVLDDQGDLVRRVRRLEPIAVWKR